MTVQIRPDERPQLPSVIRGGLVEGGYKRGVRVISCSVWPQMWQQTPLHLFFQFPVLQLPIIWVVMKYFPACIYSHLWCLMMLDGRFSPYSLPPSFPPMSARVTKSCPIMQSLVITRVRSTGRSKPTTTNCRDTKDWTFLTWFPSWIFDLPPAHCQMKFFSL